MRFHLVDLPVGMMPVCLGAESLDPLHHDSSVPGPVEDRDMSGLRHIVPESPEIVVGFFQVIRGCRRADLVTSRVEVACQTLDRAAFSSRIPSLESQYHRDPQTIEFPVERLQAFLELCQFFPVLCLLEALRKIRFCKNPFFIPVRRERSFKKFRLFSCPFFLKRLFQNIRHRLYHCKGRFRLILRIDHIPGCVRHIGPADHLVADLFVFSVVGVPLTLFFCHAPCGIL